MNRQPTTRFWMNRGGNRRRRSSLSALLLAFAFTASACDLESLLGQLEDFDLYDPCSTSTGPRDVEGEWVLTAQGSRSGCDESDFDGDFRISTVRFNVVQSPSEQETNTDDLALDEPLSEPGTDVSFRGTVRGSCVDFTAEEDGTAGFFRFVFDGNLEGVDIAGEFSGEGPPGCMSSGSFRVTIH